MATRFGNGPVLDAFTVAFRLPNLARRLFGEGALTTAFLPVFVRTKEDGGDGAAWQLATAVLSSLTLLLSLFVLIGELALWGTSRLPLAEEAELLVGLTATLLPYLILICVSAQLSAMLHAHQRFAWPALVPIVLNVIWIFGLWFVAPQWTSAKQQIYVIASCIVVAGFFQLLLPIPQLWRLGFRFQTAWRSAQPAVREITRDLLPIALGLAVTQLNSLADGLIAWAFARPDSGATSMSWLFGVDYPLSPGTAAALYFAQRLYQFPLGVFGVALGTVLFPMLARHANRGDQDAFRADLVFGLRLVIFVGLPASAGLVLLAHPLTQLFFEYGEFSRSDAAQTGAMIAAYGVAVWAYSGLLIVHRGFYAIGDRVTPMRIGAKVVACNIILNLTLIWIWQGLGLAIATALCAMAQFVIVSHHLATQVGQFPWRELGTTIGKSFAATGVMAAAVIAVLSDKTNSTLSSRVVAVGLPVLVGMAAYAITARVLKMQELTELLPGGRASE